MILSHQHRFIFIKTAKVAGTSIEVFLSRHCGASDVVTPLEPPEPSHHPRNDRGLFNPLPELLASRQGWRRCLRHLLRRHRFYGHMAAWRVRTRVGEPMWRGYYTFCVERNPWDKTLSHYAMYRKRKGRTLTFDEYLARGRFCWNYHLYTEPDDSKRIVVDRVLRYEHLERDLADVCGRLGIPFDGSLPVRAKSGYREDRRPYREVYTAEQRDIITRAFRPEIELHGYEF
jgi:hypothetical protein